MGVLVYDDVVLERAVAHGVGQVPEEHAHATALAVGICGKVSVVAPGGVLDRDQDTVIAAAAFVEVVVLEVERGLGEAVAVQDVVDRVADVERIDASSVHVGSGRGRRSQAGGVVEDETRAGLRGQRRCGALVGDDVVARSGCSGGRAVAVPALRRGNSVLGVREGLEALGGDLLPYGENKILEKQHC